MKRGIKKKFKKKPVVEVEAFQWLGHDFTKPEDKLIRYFMSPDMPKSGDCEDCGDPMKEHGVIFGRSQKFMVHPKDYIVSGDYGGVIPVRPEDFEERFLEVGVEEPVKSVKL